MLLEYEFMNRLYILMDLVSGNVMADFASEGEAWAALRSWASDDGLAAIGDLSLMRIEQGEPMLVAMDAELVRRVAHDLAETDGELVRHVEQLGHVAS
jgi:hypothetical protein